MESTRPSVVAPDPRHGYEQGAKIEPVSGLSVTPLNNGAAGEDDSRFDIWFLEFSNLYSLNLPRPNSSFSVERTGNASFYQDSSFYGRLKTQYHRGNSPIILQIFSRDARDIHSKWVKKPKGDHDATPSPTTLPRASSESERASLLNRLRDILDFLAPEEITRHSDSDDPLSPGYTRHSKRRSDDESGHSPSPKRSRSAVIPSRPPSILSRLDSGEVRGSTPVPEPTVPPLAYDGRSSQQHDMYALAPSVNTSRSSFVSKVFTETGDPEDHGLYPTTQETEVTVIAASSEHKFRPSPPSVVDCPVPSSSTKRALESSFGDCRNHQQNAGRLLGESVRSDESHPDPSKGLGKPSLDRHGHPMAITEDTLPKISHDAVGVASMNFEERLRGIWPTLPTHLRKAPLAVRWEIMRVALYCGVPMDELHFHYHPSWNDRDNLWNAFRGLDVFKDKSLPERSRVEAWNAAMSDHFSSIDQVVVLTASLAPNPSKHGLLFKLSLQPLKLDLPHRLDRRFGSDRFVEIVIPSLYTKEIKALSKGNESAVIDTVHNWLVEGSHFFLDRAWTSFYTKQATPKKIYKDDTLKPETVTIMQERVYMFAEDGNDFLRTESTRAISPRSEPNHAHTKMEREHLLEWLLQIRKNPKNQGQPLYKLFSRIALGLSRTRPTVILQHHQIRHCDTDILSPTGKVMNDGIGRMSTALVRQICVIMGLDDIPAGYQGRFGSAKGFWIRDTQDTSDDIWIETYPSQRKWVCDSEEEDHRTFEVRNASKELKSATLNLQLLPILEDGAVNALDMKKLVGKFMKDSLESEMESQKEAMKDPAHFKLWVHENTASQRRQERVRQGHVPWAAGLPTSREDQMEMLLTHGFDPTKLEFLRKIAYDMRKEKCEELQTKLNVKVGRSTYAYMVVDFSGVLEEGEVHLGFSSKFTDEQSGFSETFLHGVDVLVARTPAHYPSDIQRVKAVFKPELGLLKDVIIFSTKGDIPLADKLSGGDYDGDIAWVCWEPNIVNNFTNAPLPNVPDLFSSRVLSKVTNTYESLARIPRLRDVTTEFIDRAFRFNMEPSLLGTCTNYKEKLCYSRNSVRDEHAVFMSTLISHLVDRAKQGIVFSEQDWDRERKILNACQGDPQRARKRLDPLQPQYKHDGWRGDESPTHIIDYVKFEVGKPTVELELKKLAQYLKKAERFDADLVLFVKYYEDFKRPPALRKRDESSGNFKRNTWETVLDELKNSIDAVVAYWRNSRDEFDVKLANTHEKWQKIMPTDKVNSKTVLSLCEDSLTKVGLSQWDLLKASYCFKMYYKTNFPWYITGFQLAYLKSVVVSAKGNAPPILMTPEMYAGVRPDAKFIRAVAARNDGRYYNQASKLLEDVEDFSSEGE